MMRFNDRSIRNALCILLLVAVQPAVQLPAVAYPILGILGNTTGVPVTTPCTIVADDAWNFNDFETGSGDTFSYMSKGTVGNAPMYCGPIEFGIDCPTHAPGAGPFGSGAVHMDAISDASAEDWVNVYLQSDYRSGWQNYQDNNALTVAFHIMGNYKVFNSYGLFRPAIVWKTGEVFVGGDHTGAFADKACMNIDPRGTGNEPIIDGGGPTGDRDLYCGSDVVEGSTGVFSTLLGSIPLGEWARIAIAWKGGSSPGYTGGTIKYYVNETLVQTETGIVGRIPNSGNRWFIGFGFSRFEYINYFLDNLQIDSIAWDLARVRQANCDVPD